MSVIFGYARVSTRGQAKDGNSLEAQEQALRTAGAQRVYSDTFTGTKNNRPQLDKLINEISGGDKLIITKLDRIARSVSQGTELIESLLKKGITVHVLNMGIIDDSSTGRLIRNILLSFAEFERDMIVERTQEGKAIAKRATDYREGRPNKFTKKQLEHAMTLLEEYSYRQVSEMTGISESTIARYRRKKSND